MAIATPALAQSIQPPPLPPVDLGQTNILDGEGKPGLLLELINLGSLANDLTTAQGGSVPSRNYQRIGTFILHPIFVSTISFAGANPGVEVLLPVSWTDNNFAMNGGRHAGLGDLTVGPFLEWGAKPKAGALSVRLGLQIDGPTGDYEPGRAVNTGQGGWQISPYLAVTWRVTERWELSARGLYDWSGSAESRTSTGSHDRVQPGDLFALNLSTSYAVTGALHLGIAGFALRQLSDSSVAGAALPGSIAQIFGAGPVARLEISRTSAILFAGYGEFAAQNLPEGAIVNVRYQKAF